MCGQKYCLDVLHGYRKRSVAAVLCKAIAGKRYSSIKEICQEFFDINGIHVRFLPLEKNETKTSFVKKCERSYSVGIVYKSFSEVRCFSEAVYVLYRDMENPGFMAWYIKRRSNPFESAYDLEMMAIREEIIEIMRLFETIKVK